MIGAGFMGAAHSQAWRTAPRVFALPRDVELTVVAGRDAGRTAAAAARWGWAESTVDWRNAVARDDIDVVDVCTPGDTHAEIAIAALRAGKHVLCEKPLANSVVEAEAMAAAAEDSPARAMVGFTYRRVPAVTLARDLVADGAIGELRQARAVYLQDWLADENAPHTWRLDKAISGSGALGDIGAHIIDAVQFVSGQRVDAVSGLLRTFVTERPAGSGRAPVTVDDAAVFTGTLSGGGIATFEASRVATGRKNALRFELSGSAGAIAFDLERLNELELYRAADGPTAGFRRILATEPEHPYVAAWWPPGHGLGYEHGFSHQVKDLVEAIDGGHRPRPSFADGLQVQRVLAAVEQSAGHGSAWVPVPA
ncbi:Gfo/Idh/MocA family protein [Amycolatopsis australiensis]|nr:Gfo/Idh/MocA family oxidoreductase [Amycolatopsis australiensis]